MKDEEDARMEDDKFLSQRGGRVRLRKERSRDEEKDRGKLVLGEVWFVMDHFRKREIK